MKGTSQQQLVIKAAAYSLPRHTVSTIALVGRGLVPREIAQCSGVSRIHTLTPGTSALNHALTASKHALSIAKLSPDAVRFLLFFSSSYHNLGSMNCAGFLKHRLGLRTDTVLSLTDTQCASPHVALQLARAMAASSGGRTCGLIVGADAFSTRAIPTGALLGDGASAMVVGGGFRGAKVLATRTETDGRYHAAITFDYASRQYDVARSLSGFVRRQGIYKRLGALATATLREARVPLSDVRYLVLDNFGQLYQAKAALSLSVPVRRVFSDGVGNTGHVGGSDVIISLAKLMRRRLRAGEKVMVLSVGLGFTWACTVLEYRT